jgi:chromate transporter
MLLALKAELFRSRTIGRRSSLGRDKNPALRVLPLREETGQGVSFREASRFWVKLGFINFGGPTGQIALMHEELVERRRWISNGRFLHALNYCMLLPGPEAQQLAIYVGWLLHKVRGGLVAGIAFILPAFFLILGLSWTYAVHGDVPAIAGGFSGLQAAVVGIVAAALIRIGRRGLRNGVMVGVAVGAFVAIFLAQIPFPYIVLTAGASGLIAGRARTAFFIPPEVEAYGGDTVIRDEGPAATHTEANIGRGLRVLFTGLALWVVPLVLVSLAPGAPEILGQEARFFSQAALVTFGGAYAVLAYINQAAVEQYGWLLPGQMVTGLGLAESTPGPLVMVTEFVGFIGAYRNPGGLDPVLAGVLGATVTTWATFAPCFLWIFLGAPYIERLRGNRALTATLSAITAAVVGVILNLAVTFAIHTLFERVRTEEVLGGSVPVPLVFSIDLFAAVVAILSFVALWRFRFNVLWVVAASAVAGMLKAFVS